MELRCIFVLAVVNLVAAHGYAVKGGGAVAKAESSASATSEVGEVPLNVPAVGGFSSSFSKSSSSSFASSSSSASSSSFSYSSSGAGGLAGTNSISGKGNCVTCQDQSNGGINELNKPNVALNGLKEYTGSAAGANTFSASSGYAQNAGQAQLPCSGKECLNQGLTGAKSSSISGSLAYAQSQNQTPCTGENCLSQGSPATGVEANSFSGSSAYTQNEAKSPCTGENCSEKSKNFNCAAGLCGSGLPTGPLSYGYGPKGTSFNVNQDTKTESNDKHSKLDDANIVSFNSQPKNNQETDIFNNSKDVTETAHGSSDQSAKYEKPYNGFGSPPGCTNGKCDTFLPFSQSKTTETSYPLSSYNNQSPKCNSGKCDDDYTKIHFRSSTGGASVPIPSTYLTTPKETSNKESPCNAPFCQSPGLSDYSSTPNRPSSYNVPIYSVDATNPTVPSQEKDATCVSANCKNNYPYTDYTPNHSNTLTAGLQPVPSDTNKFTTTGTDCTSSSCGSNTADIEVPKPSSTVPHSPLATGTSLSCLSGNCASNPLAQMGIETVMDHKPKEPKLPSYLASLPNQPDKTKPFPPPNGLSNCRSGNCAYPSSFLNIGSGAGNTGSIPHSSHIAPSFNPIGHTNPISCAGPNCATYPSYETNAPLPNKKPSYFLSTPSFPNSPSSIQPPKYSNTPYPIYQVPVVGNKNPSYNAASQPSHPTQFPVSSPFQPVINPLPTHISSPSAQQGISESNQKGSVYSSGFGGPPGLLTPNDYTIPAKPLSPQQRPPVKPVYPYDGSLAPTSSTTNIPVSNSQQLPCASGNCGTLPNLSTSHYGHSSATNVASSTANSKTESKGVSYTGGFGGPPGILEPYDGNKGHFGHSGVISKPASESTYNNRPTTGYIHSSYGGFPNTASAKPNTGATSGSISFNSGHKTQENIGNGFQSGSGSSGLGNNSPYGGSSHYGVGNANKISEPSQLNPFTTGESNSLIGYPVSGSKLQTTGYQSGAAATANSNGDLSLIDSGNSQNVGTGAIAGAQAVSGSKLQTTGYQSGAAATANSGTFSGSINGNKILSACGNGDCGSQLDKSHYSGSNSDLSLINSGNSQNVGTGAIAGAQAGAFSNFGDQRKGGCGGDCALNGANSDEGSDLYGSAAIAQSSATATSGAGAGQFGLGRSFASSVATANASSGSAVKGSYGR